MIENNTKKNSGDGLLKIFSYLVVIVISLSLGIFIGRILRPDSSSGLRDVKNLYNIVGDVTGETSGVKDLDFSLFWNVWATMLNRYVDSDSIDEKSMFYGAIKGMVSSFGDPATVYLDPEETEVFNSSTTGKYFSGIGAELGYKDGQIVVISPIKGSPAISAGVKSGDIIVAVDGEKIGADETIYDIVMKIRGEAGTKVVITVYHSGETESTDIEIERGEITVPSMDFEVSEIDKNYVIFDISRFTDSSLNDWEKSWDKMVDQYLEGDYKGIIIDLRGNPGGFLNAAVYAANEFLEKGEIVYQSENRNGDVSEYKVDRKGKLIDVPVVILVNEGSASASEILTGALQLNNRIEVVGVPSYGKGTAQEIVDFGDGSSLHITIMKWLLPDGSWINPENTIKPDYEIELTDEDFKAGIDPQMEKAVEVIRKMK